MKKTVYMLLAVIMALLVTACGKTEATPAETPETPPEVTASSEQTETESATSFDSDRIASIKEQLRIPDDLETEDRIFDDAPNFWEGAGIWTVTCEFYHDGQLVACADVNQETGELARNIMVYEQN